MIEEYRQKWEYVRHIEKLRHQFVTGMLILATALMSFVLEDADDVFDVRNDSDMVLLAFVWMIFVFGQLFVLSQKVGYHHYVKRLRSLDGTAGVWMPTRFTTFRSQYAVVATLGTGLAALAAIAVTDAIDYRLAGVVGGSAHAVFSWLTLLVAEHRGRTLG